MRGDKMFEEFKKMNLTTGVPSMTITENGVGFSKAAIVKLEKPEYVILMIDEQGKRLAIQSCEKSNPDATPFLRRKNVITVRWNNKDLLNTICRMMEWDTKTNSYKIEGQYIGDENAMIFDLNYATIEDKDD